MSEPQQNQNLPKSAYMKLAQIVTDIKEEKITTTDAIKKIQLREGAGAQVSSRPYAKVTKNGAVALYGISKDPIILYESQWNRLQKTVECGYLKKYMEYNKERISHNKPGVAKAEAGVATENVVAEVATENVVAEVATENVVAEVVGLETVVEDVTE